MICMLSGQETSGQNHILDSCFPSAYTSNMIFTINSFKSSVKVLEKILTGENSLNSHSSVAVISQIVRIIHEYFILFQNGILS